MGWITWGTAQYVGFALYEKDYGLDKFLLVVIAASTAGFVLTSALRYVCRVLWRQRPTVLIIGGLAGAYCTALVFRVPINLTDWYGMKGYIKLDHWYDVFMGVIPGTALMLCWMGLYFGFHFYEANQLERERSLRADALAQAAQFKMLRYQLNPHFLFNTLNAISTLVLDDRNAVANTVITRLAEFLRYTLDQDPMKTVTLTQEVAALDLYLQIEKVRFGQRLRVTIDVPPEAGAVQVPSLLLQPLIENAIKYAIAPSEQGGSIVIRAQLDQDMIVLTVADDGPGIRNSARLDSGRGVGLRNTRERLLAMYGEYGRMEHANTDPGLCITLRFPAKR